MTKKIIAVATALIACFTIFCICAFATSSSVFIVDDANVINDESEPMIIAEAERVAKKTGFNIIIATTNDIGTPKTDARSVAYADDMYDALCGINTDGILLLINCDTKCDHISTSGSCINYFSDARIDAVFDDIWDDMVDGNFDRAANGFVLSVEKYYDKGKANHQQEIAGLEIDLVSFTVSFFPFSIFGLIVGIILYAGFSTSYRIEKPQTRNYVLENSLAFDRREDVYAGTNVNRIYTPRSSSSSSHGSHSSSHRSSTHHSSSGGRHGGGSRHR